MRSFVRLVKSLLKETIIKELAMVLKDHEHRENKHWTTTTTMLWNNSSGLYHQKSGQRNQQALVA